MTDLTGQMIKGYELNRMIGQGGFGAVYSAFQSLVKREVAVKIILPEYASQPDFVRGFEAEARLVARLEHLHIVPLYDYWRDPSGAYLVMRLLKGGSLELALKSGPWDLESAARLLEQIAAALTVAHRNGVIHRDIKPANILLDEEWNAYLSDFGIAKDLTEEKRDSGVVGSPIYISPEQIRSLPISPQTDIYGMGMVMYQLITGQLPFRFSSSSDLIMKHLNEPLPEIHLLDSAFPEALNFVLQQATAKDPQERFEDVRSFASAFRKAIQGKTFIQTRRAGATEDDFGDLSITFNTSTPISITADMLLEEAAEIVNPYKGLKAFQEADSEDFFGRQALTDQLVDRLKQSDDPMVRFLAVVGPSGSGKSSVVKAGVIPALRKGALHGSERWFIVEMVPGTNPLNELTSALLSVCVRTPDKEIAPQILKDPRALVDIVDSILPADGSELLILIDQFEEAFTQAESDAVRTAFLNGILAATTNRSSRLRVIVTLRADFYHLPLLYPEFGALMRQRTEVVLPMSSEELEQAVTGPAHRVSVEVEPTLLATIVSDVKEEPGALPLLQYALTELFARREGKLMTLAAYESSGGVLGALARRAEELYTEMDEPHQQTVRQLFLRLVTLGEGTEDTRRRILWSEIASFIEENSNMQDVLNSYGKYRLLTFDVDPNTREPTIEVAHEALIRRWERLREWLDANRNDLRLQRRLYVSTMEWANQRRDPSFLASGIRLQQYEQLLTSDTIKLTTEENEYVQLSIAKRERELEAERLREARERELEKRARQRLRVLALVLLMGFLGAAVMAGIAFNASQEAARERDNAQEARDEAQEQRDVSERRAAEAKSLTLSVQSEQALDGGNPFLAVALALAANESNRDIITPPAQSQDVLADVAWNAKAVRHYLGHTARVWRIAINTAGTRALSGSEDQTMILWDIATGEVIRQYGMGGTGHTDRVYGVEFVQGTSLAVSGSGDTTLIVWDLDTGEALRRMRGHDATIWGIDVSPDGMYALSASEDRYVILWDIEKGTEVRRFGEDKDGNWIGHTAAVYAVVFSPDGKYALSGGGDNIAILWDVETGEVIRKYGAEGEGHSSWILSLDFAPNGKYFVTGSLESENKVIVWNVESGVPIYRLSGHSLFVRSVAISQDSRFFASGSEDSTLILWDFETGQAVRTFKGHTDFISGIRFLPNGQFLLSGSSDSSMILWDLRPASELTRLEMNSSVRSVEITPDETSVLAGLEDGRVVLAEIEGGAIIRSFEGHRGTVYDTALSVDGEFVVSGGADGIVRLWNVDTGELVRAFEGHSVRPVRTVALSADDRYILSGSGNVLRTDSNNNEMILWDASTGAEIRRFTGHSGAVNAIAFSPDGTLALSASDDATVRLWDVNTGALLFTFEGHTAAVRAIAFSPDGSFALSGSRDNNLILWDLNTRSEVRRFNGHSSSVRSVAFMPDGRFALSGAGNIQTREGADYALILWDVGTGDVIRRFDGHTRTVYSVAISTDAKFTVSGSDDGQIIQWRLDTLDELIMWTRANYDVYELTCLERDIYQVEPLCSAEELFAEDTSTPAPVDESEDDVEVEIAAATDRSVCPVVRDLPPVAEVDTSAYAKDAPYTIGFLNGNAAGDAWDKYMAAWLRYEAAQHTEITLTEADANGSVPTQIQQVSEMVNAGVDLLILRPLDARQLVPAVTAAMESGVPVVLVGDGLNGDNYVTFISADNFNIGCLMAQELVLYLDGDGNVIQLNGIAGSVEAEEKLNGALALLRLYPDINIIVQAYTDFEPTVAGERTKGFILSNQLHGILADHATIGLAALQALQESGVELVPAVADQRVDLAQFALNNNVSISQVGMPTTIGRDAITTALQILRGEPILKRINVDLMTIPSETLTDEVLSLPPDAWLGEYDSALAPFLNEENASSSDTWIVGSAN